MEWLKILLERYWRKSADQAALTGDGLLPAPKEMPQQLTPKRRLEACDRLEQAYGPAASRQTSPGHSDDKGRTPGYFVHMTFQLADAAHVQSRSGWERGIAFTS